MPLHQLHLVSTATMLHHAHPHLTPSFLSLDAVSLAKSDRPMDLLNVLKSLLSSNQRLPKSTTRPLMDAPTMPGTTIATVRLVLVSFFLFFFFCFFH